jgi:hypothetical protein
VDADGRILPGTWGNDADPSGVYITWLSQGGDAAVEWCALELAPKATAIATDPAPVEVLNAV